MKLNLFKELPLYPMGPAVKRELIAYQEGENGYTVNRLIAPAGAGAPLHSHPHLQFNYMISGCGEFQVGDETVTLKAGDTLQIDSNVPHTFNSFSEPTEWLEFFTPVREDFKP